MSLVEFDCAGEVTGVVEVPRAAVARRATRDAEGGTMAVAVQSGSTLQAGLGSAGEYAILADLVVGQRDDAETDLRTVLHIVKNGVVLEEVRIRGNYSILDSRPGVGLLVTSYDPFPHVFVVPEEELLQVLRRRW